MLRYYVRGSVAPFEEDSFREFKGHSNLSTEEVNPSLWLSGADAGKRSRQPVSRVLNAFLNTGKGGITHLGIVDDGTIKGINLTQYKKDHFIAALDDLMSRYHPPVEQHRYSVKFVPLVDPDMTNEEIIKAVTFDTRSAVVAEERKRPHILRTYKYCWCDMDTAGRVNNGLLAHGYVIEVVMKAWDPSDPRNQNAVGEMRAHPIHEDETGRTYFRRQASVVQYNVQEQCRASRDVVTAKYQPIKDKLLEEVEKLRSEVAKASQRAVRQ